MKVRITNITVTGEYLTLEYETLIDGVKIIGRPMIDLRGTITDEEILGALKADLEEKREGMKLIKDILQYKDKEIEV